MAEYRNRLRVLHLCLHSDLLPQDASRHAGPRHPQPDREQQYLHIICSIYYIYFYTLSTLFMLSTTTIYNIISTLSSHYLHSIYKLSIHYLRYVQVRTTLNSTSWTLDKHGTNPHHAFFFVECVCNAWFTLEFFIR